MAAMASNGSSEVVNKLFGPCESIAERFPGLDGVLLQEAIWTAYAIERDANIDYFKPDGTPNVCRHRLNDRDQEATTESLACSVERQGALVGVRGNAWAVKGADMYNMLTWGHLCEAVLMAAGRSPDNAYVKATLKRGIVSATIFGPQTPDDVLHHLVRMHNNFHRGSSSSFVDLLSDLVKIEAKWAIHRQQNKIQSRGGTGENAYQALYWKFVSSKYPNFCSTWPQYESWKTVLNFLEKKKMFGDFKTEFNKITKFMDARLKNDVVMSMLHHCINSLAKIAPCTTEGLFKLFHLELFKFCIPVRVNSRGLSELQKEA